MKSKLAVLGSLFVASLGWAAPQEFTFVTTLSSPVASFKEIETKYTQVPTEFGNDTEVNLGSPQSGSGTIVIQGGAPVQIDQLAMEQDTTFSVGNNKKWIVDYLTIGADGEVSPQSASIQKLQVPSGSKLTVNQKLKMPGPVVLNEDSSGSVNKVTIGSASSQLTINSLGQGGTGTFNRLPCNQRNIAAGLCSASQQIYGLEVQ